MPYATIRGLRLFYKDVGAGPPLMVIPGLGVDSMAYNPLIPHLRERIRLIAPDPWGLGRSAEAPGPLSSRQLSEDLRDLLDHLGIVKASVLGTSMGALVARRFATLFPDRVARLVLCSAGKRDAPYARRMGRLLGALVKGTPPQELMGHMLTLILSPEYIDEHEGLLRDLEQLMQPNESTLRTMALQVAMMEAEAADTMGEIQVPVLIMSGARDRVVPLEYATVLQESLPGSRLVIIQNAAHHLFLEARDEALKGLLDFLEEA
jgi:3-oxoadipate enol-lactonase